MQPASDLYENEAETYELLANDRDFDAQVVAIMAQLGDPAQVVIEAFAGPAYHAHAWRQRQPGCQVWCVDTAPAMREVACSRSQVDPASYRVARIEQVLAHDFAPGSVDVVLGLRFSVGHLNPVDCAALLAGVDRCLRPGGIAVLEIYSPRLMALAMQSMSVVERRVPGPEGSVGFTVPSGPLQWAEDDWVVRVPWHIKWYDREGALVREAHYVSTERLYTSGELARMSRSISSLQVEAAHEGLVASFPMSHVMVLRKPRL